MKFPAFYIALVLVGVFFFTGSTPREASAADWGRGTFTGKVKGQFGPRKASKIVLSAKGNKVRIKSLKLDLECADDKYGLPRHWRPTIHSTSERVTEGAAGGGAILKFKVKEKYKDQRVPIRIEAFLGLRETKIDGTIDAEVFGDLLICSDDGIFTARR